MFVFSFFSLFHFSRSSFGAVFLVVIVTGVGASEKINKIKSTTDRVVIRHSLPPRPHLVPWQVSFIAPREKVSARIGASINASAVLEIFQHVVTTQIVVRKPHRLVFSLPLFSPRAAITPGAPLGEKTTKKKCRKRALVTTSTEEALAVMSRAFPPPQSPGDSSCSWNMPAGETIFFFSRWSQLVPGAL